MWQTFEENGKKKQKSFLNESKKKSLGNLKKIQKNFQMENQRH